MFPSPGPTNHFHIPRKWPAVHSEGQPLTHFRNIRTQRTHTLSHTFFDVIRKHLVKSNLRTSQSNNSNCTSYSYAALRNEWWCLHSFSPAATSILPEKCIINHFSQCKSPLLHLVVPKTCSKSSASWRSRYKPPIFYNHLWPSYVAARCLCIFLCVAVCIVRTRALLALKTLW